MTRFEEHGSHSKLDTVAVISRERLSGWGRVSENQGLTGRDRLGVTE